MAQSIALSHLDIRLHPLANRSTPEFDIFRMLAERRVTQRSRNLFSPFA
ncbi:MAG: hypothetical protein ACREVH_00815 [Gammaproteobacteria bacterium]